MHHGSGAGRAPGGLAVAESERLRLGPGNVRDGDARRERNTRVDPGAAGLRGGNIRPAVHGASLRAAEPVLAGTHRFKAELASVIGDAEGRHERLSGLGPLSATDSRGQVTPKLRVPHVANIPGATKAGFALEYNADSGNARHKDGSEIVVVLQTAVCRCR